MQFRKDIYLIRIPCDIDVLEMMRQYEALKSLGCLKSNLRRAIFCETMEGSDHNRSIVSDIDIQPNKPASVISDVWDVISRQTNAYQLSTIESVMLGKAKENVSLLQGPPGTGKTLTIVALVSALLNGSVPISGAKNPRTAGTKVQVRIWIKRLSLTSLLHYRLILFSFS